MYNYLLILSALWPAKFGAALPPLEELRTKWEAVEPRLMAEATIDTSAVVVRAEQLASNVLSADIAAVRTQHADSGGEEQPGGEADDQIRAGQAVAVMAAAQPTCAELFTSNLLAVRDMMVNAQAKKKQPHVEGERDDDGDDDQREDAGACDDTEMDASDSPTRDVGDSEARDAPMDEARDGEPGAEAGTQPAPIQTGREEEPVNEYVDNAALLRGAFFHLFIAPPLPLADNEDGVDSLVGRTGHGGLASLSRSTVQHLLRQHTGAFAKEKHLLFLLMNQIQRRAASRAVTALLNDNPHAFKVFQARCAHRVPLPNSQAWVLLD
jgi:hypothetical protein